MQKISLPLLIAAGHTLARQAVGSCQFFVVGTLHGAKLLMHALMLVTLWTLLMVSTLMLSFMMIVFPFQVVALYSEGKSNHLLREHEGIFVHLGQPTELGFGLYFVVLITAYALSVAYAIRSGEAAIEQAKPGQNKVEAWAYSSLWLVGRGYANYFNQIMSGKFLGWDGMLAAPFRHGWKIILSSLAMPIHVITCGIVLVKPLFKSCFNFFAKLGKTSPLGDALERLAQGSPEVLARHEAKSLRAQTSHGKEEKNKKRL